jgi:hypothetical protein
MTSDQEGEPLLTLRELVDLPDADENRWSISLIRSWIYVGIGKHRLRTYRAEGSPHTVRVKLSDVLNFADRGPL